MNTPVQSESFLRRVARVMRTPVPSRNLDSSDFLLHGAVLLGTILTGLLSLGVIAGIEVGKSVDDSSDLGRKLLELETAYRALPTPHLLENAQFVSARQAAIAAYDCKDKSFLNIDTGTNFNDLLLTFNNRVNWTCNTDSPSE